MFLVLLFSIVSLHGIFTLPKNHFRYLNYLLGIGNKLYGRATQSKSGRKYSLENLLQLLFLGNYPEKRLPISASGL